MAHAATEIPAWLGVLDDEDRQFLKRFLLASGSLKELAAEYGVSYPTVRSRLDRLIAKVREADAPEPADPFERHVRILVADGKVPASLARDLVEVYWSARNGKEKRR